MISDDRYFSTREMPCAQHLDTASSYASEEERCSFVTDDVTERKTALCVDAPVDS